MALSEKIPPPKPPRPEKSPPPPPPEKKEPSIWEKGPIKSGFFSKEFKKDEYFQKLKGIPQKEREEIGKLLGDKKLFGELIEKSESWKLQSLEKELKMPGSSSDPKIREIGKTIREKYGNERAKILADIIHKKFF